MRAPREIERHRAAAELKRIAMALGAWQIEQSLLISRKLNNKLFEAELLMRRAAQEVWKGYDGD